MYKVDVWAGGERRSFKSNRFRVVKNGVRFTDAETGREHIYIGWRVHAERVE